jgi:hypothetical protein
MLKITPKQLDDARKQVEALVYAGEAMLLVQFMLPMQQEQLAEDWNAERER